MPFVGGRVSVQVNGKEVAHDRARDHGTKAGTHSLIPVQNVTIGSGNTPVLVSAGTVNLTTHAVSVTFSAALPVGAVVKVVVLADYERKDSNGNSILTPPGAEIDLEYASLYADAMRIQVSATQDAAQQMAAELGISFNAAALGILQNKFYLERNIRLLEDAKERAEANDSVVQFDAQRGVTTGATAAFNDTGEMMQEMSTALDKGKLMIANKVGGSSAGYDFFVTDNAAILISHISGDRFIRTGSQIGTDTAIVLIGRFNDGTNVYYVPKNAGLFEETGTTSEGLARTDDLPLFVAVLRSAQKLNIPLDCEVDPTFNADQAIDYVEGLDIRDHRVATYWNPTLSRPRDAVSIRGALKPRPILGWLMGTRLLRNSRTNAQGIPPIQDPVAGYRYPIPFKRIKMRDDVQLDEFTIKRLAKAKINVVQPQDGSQGTRFVVGDVLTQYQSVNSVLRLTSSAEIECYTANTIIQIIHEHMLMGMTDFLTKANRACIEFLDKCSSQQAQLLVPAEDLGGAPYSLQLSPDSEKPFERVRVVFARRPNGVARSVVLDTTVNK